MKVEVALEEIVDLLANRQVLAMLLAMADNRKIEEAKELIETVARSSEEQTEFTVVLASAGEKKIEVIKKVRAITGLGLKEAKDLVEQAPTIVREHVSKVEAAKIRAQLEHVGAKTELTIYGP